MGVRLWCKASAREAWSNLSCEARRMESEIYIADLRKMCDGQSLCMAKGLLIMH